MKYRQIRYYSISNNVNTYLFFDNRSDFSSDEGHDWRVFYLIAPLEVFLMVILL